jgi:AcrR family transcriptional regulator
VTDVRGAPTRKKRRPERRDQILQIAVRLFHERGFHGTGMDDIGEVAGITGPAIYRHFSSKEEILAEAIRRVADERRVALGEIARSSSSPEETLEKLARSHALSTLANPSLVAVVVGERRVLDGAGRAAIDRAVRERVDEWVEPLRQLRPELSDPEARLMVVSAFTLIQSVIQHDSGLDPEIVEDLLVRMAMDSLLGHAVGPPPRFPATRQSAE